MTEKAAVLPAFKSAEGMAAYLRAYDAVLREWPVPFVELDVPTSFGSTHVIASDPADAPALLRRAAQRLPHLEGAVIPGAHHLAALARPDDVNARSSEFLGREHPALAGAPQT